VTRTDGAARAERCAGVDLAGFVPARLTWLLIAAAALLRGERSRAALRLGWRDSRKHPSPNAAWGQAAMAGALGVQLGGPATYGGGAASRPLLGDPGGPIGPATVRRAVGLMRVATLFAVVLAWGLRLWVENAAYPRRSQARPKPPPMAAARAPTIAIRATRGLRSASAARGRNQGGYSGAIDGLRTGAAGAGAGAGAAATATGTGAADFGAAGGVGFRGATSAEDPDRDRGRKSA
jgi:hypothetical protein